MNTVFWTFSRSIGITLAGAVFGVVAVWFFLRNLRRNRGRPLYVALEVLRLLVMAMLIATLFQPEFVRLTRKLERPRVAVLCDGSGSMATRDVVAGGGTALSREAWVTDQKTNRFWAPLEARYTVSVDDFAMPVVATNAAPTTNAPAADPGTDLNGALEAALGKYDTLRAVLLLSDGDWNEGGSPVAAATRLRMRGVPVYGVTVGSERYLPDLELLSVSAPAYGLMDEHVALPFTLQSRLPREVRTVVTLYSSSGVESSKEITIPPMAQLQDSVVLVPRSEGEARLTLKFPVERDETFDDNNAKDFQIVLRREKIKVLVIDSLPRWEYRYLRNALMRDPGIDGRFLLLHPGMDPATGAGYLPSFPGTREELSTYDVVFIGDVGLEAGRLTEEHAGMLKALVEQQGSGVVFLPGQQGKQKSLLPTALGEIMPVVLNDNDMAGYGSAMEARLTLTERGRDHLLTLLEADPLRNEALWKRLPGFFWYAPAVKAKSGADVLAVHSVARQQEGRVPLLVTRNVGNGKVLFMGTDSAWRWRKGVEDTYHYRFWGQVVRWMAHQRHLAYEEGIRFFFSPESPVRGQQVFLHATVFDASGYPVSGGTVHVTLAKGSGPSETVDLNPEAGGWGVFTGSFEAKEGGAYDITIECPEANRRVKTRMEVSVSKREKTGVPARAGVLREIAAVTGGRAGGTEDLKKLVETVSILPEPEPVEERFRLWCHPAWIGLIVLLMGVYWSGRKWLGLV